MSANETSESSSSSSPPTTHNNNHIHDGKESKQNNNSNSSNNNINNNNNSNNNSSDMIDITKLLFDASTNGLSYTNPIIHNHGFTLYDSMSALELTDPKMDSCEIPLSYYATYSNKNGSKNGNKNSSKNGNKNGSSSSSKKTNIQEPRTKTVPPRPLPTDLTTTSSSNSNNYPPWKSISYVETKDIVLELISKLNSFLNGSSLAESIYTCYYVHESVLGQMDHVLHTLQFNLDAIAEAEQKDKSNSSDDDDDDDDYNNDQNHDQNHHHHHDHDKESKLNLNEYEIAQILLCLTCHLVVYNTKLVRKTMLHADIYEEEDFMTNAYAFFPTSSKKNQDEQQKQQQQQQQQQQQHHHPNKKVITVEQIIHYFEIVQSTISHTKSNEKQGQGQGQGQGQTTSVQENENKNENTTNRNIQMILNSIQYLIDLYTVTYNLSSQLTKQNVIAVTSNMKSYIDTSCLPNLSSLMELYEEDEYDNVVAVVVDEDEDKDKDEDESKSKKKKAKELLLFKTFDPYVNRHLLGNSPVRNVSSYYATTTLESLQSLYAIMYEFSNAVCAIILHGKDMDSIYSILHSITSTSSSTAQATIPVSTVTQSSTSTSTSTSTKMKTLKLKSNSASNTSTLNILCRSILVINMYFDERLLGQHILPSIISNNMVTHYNVPSTVTQGTEYGIQYLSRLGKPIYDTMKLLLLNKSRQRIFIEDVMFREWNFLLQEAAIVDHCFHRDYLSGSGSGGSSTTSNAAGGSTGGSSSSTTGENKMLMPFVSNYILCMIVELMEYHICVGIEVGLFTGCWHLLCGYWYLDFLSSTRLNLVNGMRNCMKERKALEDSMAAADNKTSTGIGNNGNRNNNNNGNGNGNHGGNKGKKKGKKSKKTQQANSNRNANANANANSSTLNKEVMKSTPEDTGDDLDVLVLKMKRLMYRGIVRSIAIIYQANIISKPMYEFTTTEKIFEKRFECFHQFRQPPALTYNDFQKGTDFSSVSSNDLISSSSDCFKTCRNLLSDIMKKLETTIDSNYCIISKEEVMSVTKVCIANSLFLLKVSSYIRKGESLESYKVSFDLETHGQFCSINIS